MGHRAGAVRLHREERAVQADLGRLHLRSVFGVAGVFQTVGGFRRYALPRDVVLPDSGAARGVASSA